MTRLTDNKKTVEITMRNWRADKGSYDPDLSADFFEVGSLPYDADEDAHIVDNVDYCVDRAYDWADMIGDFREEDDVIEYEKASGIERTVNVNVYECA